MTKKSLKKSDRQFLLTLDRFVFAIVAATIFTFSLCSWLLDINYKYTTDMTGIIVDVNHVFYIAAIASIYYLFRKGHIEFDFSLVMLCTVFVLIAIIDYHIEDYVPVNYAWIIPMAYIVGKLIAGTDKTTINKKIIAVYVVMAIPAYIQSMLDFGMNWKVNWEYGTERWNEFWTGVIEPRTTYEMGFILTTSAFAVAIMCFKKHKALSIVIIAANVLLQYVVMKCQGRQNPLMLIITIGLVMCLYAYDNWSKENKRLKIIVFAIIAAGVAGLAVIAILFATNAFGLMDAYRASYWADGGLLKNERIDIDWTAFQSMLQWPVDNYETRAGLARAHSMVLEYGRVYDMTVYIGLTLIRIIFIVQAVRMALTKSANAWIKYLIIPAFVCLNLYYTMEPNAHAHRYLWMPGLLVSGMISGWLELEKKPGVYHESKAGVIAKKANINVEV